MICTVHLTCIKRTVAGELLRSRALEIRCIDKKLLGETRPLIGVKMMDIAFFGINS